MARSLFASGNTYPHKLHIFRRQRLGSQIRVLEVGIASVDNQIARLKVGQKIVND